jgi:hypothetical protein
MYRCDLAFRGTTSRTLLLLLIRGSPDHRLTLHKGKWWQECGCGRVCGRGAKVEDNEGGSDLISPMKVEWVNGQIALRQHVYGRTTCSDHTVFAHPF